MWLAWALLLLRLVLRAAAQRPVVETTHGLVAGRVYEGCDVFRGIPYAEPPVGEKRWRAPVPKARWSGVRPALKPAPECPQLDITKGVHFGSEDCLYISVYRPPSCTSVSPCAVMFWIYGGAWTIGSNGEYGLYTGEHLAMKNNIIVVAANYRLDVLGWLALEELHEGEAYGNYGLRDQTLALSWTRDNARRFGGDPDRVTLFGESAGGFSACQHLTSPASNGLFSRAIMQSGDCDGPWLIVDGEDAKRFGDFYATKVGCPPDNSTTEGLNFRAACLRGKSQKQIMEPYLSWICPKNTPRPNDPWCNTTQEQLENGQSKSWPANRPPFAPIGGWTAVVDGSFSGLPDTPYRMMQRGQINLNPQGEPLQIIMGTNQDEMALFLISIDLMIPTINLPIGNGAIPHIAEHLVQYHDHWNATTVSQIVEAYTTGFCPGCTASYRFVQCSTDLAFRCGTRRAARVLSAAGSAVYLYNFNHHFTGYRDPNSTVCQRDSEVGCGVCHASELRFVFDNYLLPLDTWDRRMADTIGELWASFAKVGTPNEVEGVHWPKYNASSDLHLEIRHPLGVKSGLSREQCDFWDTLAVQDGYPHR
eukprot:COSAG05_NODE_593_length_8488_cov_13.560367_5_plen_590_part_00